MRNDQIAPCVPLISPRPVEDILSEQPANLEIPSKDCFNEHAVAGMGQTPSQPHIYFHLGQEKEIESWDKKLLLSLNPGQMHYWTHVAVILERRCHPR